MHFKEATRFKRIATRPDRFENTFIFDMASNL